MQRRYLFTLILTLLAFSTARAQQPAPILLPERAMRAVDDVVPGGDERVGVIIRTTDVAALEQAGVDIQTRLDGFVTARVRPEDLARIAAVEGVKMIENPIEYAHNDVAAALTGVQALRSGILGGTAYTGAGVIVCVIDSGIDWRHGDFRDPADPTKSRILAIWDHTLIATPGEAAPAPYGYGVEYTQAAIEAALAGGTALRSADTDGHGTHVAGTAAGNGASLSPAQHVGMAPEAEIIAVKAGNGSYATANIIDGITYCDEKAAAEGKPVVVNMSLGSDSGPHDGTDAKSVAINTFAAKAGRALVQSAGNSGGDAIHVTRSVAAGAADAFTITVPAYTPSLNPDDFLLDVWFGGSTGVNVTVTSPNGHTATQTAGGQSTTSTADGDVYLFNFLDSGNLDRRIYISVNDGSGTAPAAGVWTVQLNNTSGVSDTYHAWLFDAEVTGTLVTFGGADGDYTVSNVAANGITVGSYVHRWRWTASAGGGYSYVGGELSNDLSSFSSRGPDRNGLTMPHLTAPGQAMASSLSQDAAAFVPSALLLPGGQHYVTQGTSMSSPVVAGIAALVLQQAPTLTGVQVQQALVNASDADAYTLAVPNNRFGAGKVNAYAAVARLVSGNSTPGFQAIGYDEAMIGSVNLTNGQALSVQFQQTLGHEGRVRGVLLHPSSLVSPTGSACVAVYTDDGAGNPNTRIGSCMGFPMASVAPNTWNYADLSAANIDLLSGVNYHLVVTMDGTTGSTGLFRDATAAAGRRSLLNTGSGWTKQSFDWAVRPLVSSTASALPVELAVFDGVLESHRAVLTWLTVSETNNAGFHVAAQHDGGVWSDVGFVDGKGTTIEASRYHFETGELAPGVHRFKLRQVDFDGSVTESAIVELTVDAARALALTVVGANPSRDGVSVTFTVPRTGEAIVDLYDVLGRRVATLFEGEVQAGAVQQATRSADGLAAGVYVVRLVHEGAQQTQRVVLAR